MAAFRASLVCAALAACGDSTAIVPDAAAIPEGPDGLVVWYELDDEPADGMHATYGLDGKCSRCPSLVAGHIGGAHHYDGAAKITTAPLPPAYIDATAVTAAAWIRVTNNEAVGCFVGEPTASGVGNAFQMCVRADLGVYGCGHSGGGDCVASNPGVVTAGVWTHLLVTIDATSITTFVDRVQVVTGPAVFTHGAGSIAVGADIDFGGVIAAFTGDIDDVRVWNRVLTSTEIAAEAAR